MNAPAVYLGPTDPRVIPLGELFAPLLADTWEERDQARKEQFFSDRSDPYTYGKGLGQRTYLPRPWSDPMREARKIVEEITDCVFEVCFNNRYDGPQNALGWHADDSPELDPSRPIAVVSFGAVRDIMFRLHGAKDVERLTLETPSVLIMLPGMQQTHQHRIPKHSAQCGVRISLTFRGLK